ncbi:MAG: UDP-2,3-diacylglucosamine diphosphatase [Zoogloeaceae bacterium]|nr:UDP-2,3-diacylglucosamine diphosphatase [Zoogloeaceae bacterium]
MTLFFISDLHLSPRTPGATRIFTDFLAASARPGAALYVLGDFFEAWAGDDAASFSPYREIFTALRRARAAGLALFFQHGNRDFLLGKSFTAATGATLLPDPYVLSTAKWQFVLSHGDRLCTDDTAYQNFRALTRSAPWQHDFLARSLEERLQLAEKLRAQSEVEKRDKPYAQTDLNPAATDDFLRACGYATFIHGHTHRPARHDHLVDGIHVERWVLADWSETRGEALVWDEKTLCRRVLPASDREVVHNP